MVFRQRREKIGILGRGNSIKLRRHHRTRGVWSSVEFSVTDGGMVSK